MEIIFLVLLLFDFAFLNFVAICYLSSMIKLNKMKEELSNVDLSSIGIK